MAADLSTETLAFLEREAGEHARYPQYYTKLAHAAACVRFVQALERGEVWDAIVLELTSGEMQTRISTKRGRFHGPTPLAAYAAATGGRDAE